MIFIGSCKVSRSEQKRSLLLFTLVTSICILVYLLISRFPVRENSIYPSCVWHHLTKTYCTGCGTMRGLNDMVNGNILGLFRNNILAFFVLPFLFYTYIVVMIRGIFSYHLPILSFNTLELYGLLFIVIIYTVIRNIVPLLAPIM